jgi:DNA polymerase III epsilon subunit
MRRKFYFFVGLCSLVAAMGTAIWLAAFWQRLSPAEEALFTHLFMQRFVHIFLTAFFIVCALALLLGVMLHYYIIPLRRLAEETTLIATVNPSHRIVLDGAGDIQKLAKTINDGAGRIQKLQEGIGERVRNERARVEAERNKLASIISGLTEGVMVCNNAGSILLYNSRAKALLSPYKPAGSEASGNSGLVGLGRSVLDILDKEEIEHGLHQIEIQKEQGTATPFYSFISRDRGDRQLLCRMSPVTDQAINGSGYILTCHDVTPGHAEVRQDGEDLNTLPGQGQTAMIEPERPEFYDFDLFKQSKSVTEIEKSQLTDLNYTVFDTETTGLDPVGGDEIISIGAVRIVNCRLLQEEIFNQLVDPKWYMRPEVIRVHGIQPEMLTGQPTIDQVLPHFRDFVGDCVLVAHNAAFDMRFLQLNEKRTGIIFANPVLDTLLLSAFVHPNQESHSLEAIARRLGVDVRGRHTALGDAILTGEIFLKLISLLKRTGIRTLHEALTASRETYFSRLTY